MRLEDMREQFPKMPESMKRMIVQVLLTRCIIRRLENMA